MCSCVRLPFTDLYLLNRSSQNVLSIDRLSIKRVICRTLIRRGETKTLLFRARSCKAYSDKKMLGLHGKGWRGWGKSLRVGSWNSRVREHAQCTIVKATLMLQLLNIVTAIVRLHCCLNCTNLFSRTHRVRTTSAPFVVLNSKFEKFIPV
jgi:hypothetical protein